VLTYTAFYICGCIEQGPAARMLLLRWFGIVINFCIFLQCDFNEFESCVLQTINFHYNYNVSCYCGSVSDHLVLLLNNKFEFEFTSGVQKYNVLTKGWSVRSFPLLHFHSRSRRVGEGQSELRLSRWLRRQWAMIASTSNFSASTTTHHRHAPAPPTISCCCCWHAASMETVIDRPHPAAVRCRPPAAVAYQNMDSRSRQQRLLGGRVSHWVNLTDDAVHTITVIE